MRADRRDVASDQSCCYCVDGRNSQFRAYFPYCTSPSDNNGKPPRYPGHRPLSETRTIGGIHLHRLRRKRLRGRPKVTPTVWDTAARSHHQPYSVFLLLSRPAAVCIADLGDPITNGPRHQDSSPGSSLHGPSIGVLGDHQSSLSQWGPGAVLAILHAGGERLCGPARHCLCRHLHVS